MTRWCISTVHETPAPITSLLPLFLLAFGVFFAFAFSFHVNFAVLYLKRSSVFIVECSYSIIIALTSFFLASFSMFTTSIQFYRTNIDFNGWIGCLEWHSYIMGNCIQHRKKYMYFDTYYNLLLFLLSRKDKNKITLL